MAKIKCSVGRCFYNTAKESKSTDGICKCNVIQIKANSWDGGNSVFCENYCKSDKPFGEYTDSDY